MQAQICWATYADPNTLVNVGVEAIAMRFDNIIVFTDSKTKARTYQRMSKSLSRIAGHNRFPMYAAAESVMRPMITVHKYPDQSVFSSFPSPNILTYVDLRFTESEYLIALGGFPKFLLRILNFRTEQVLVECSTFRHCQINALLVSPKYNPMISMFSSRQMEISIWEMCQSAESTKAHEVSIIPLRQEYTHSKEFNMCYSDDGSLYIINDNGVLSLVETSHFALRPQWTDMKNDKPRCYRVFYNKFGFLVTTIDCVYFVKKRTPNFITEWIFESSNMKIIKCLSNMNNDIFVADNQGKLFRIDVESGTNTKLTEIITQHYAIAEFSFIKGVREENILLLIENEGLRSVEISHMFTFSIVEMENAKTIACHNSLPFVAIGTSDGQIKLMSFEKLRSPHLLYTFENVDNPAPIHKITLMDTCCFVLDDNNAFNILKTNFKASLFSVGQKLEPIPPTEMEEIVDVILIDEQYVMIFPSVERNEELQVPYSTQLWVCDWAKFNLKSIQKLVFDLPHGYRSIAVTYPISKDSVEFHAIRVCDNVIDEFILVNKSTLKYVRCFKTNHIGFINGMVGSRNLITCSTDGTMIHFRTHKKSKSKTYGISRYIYISTVPRVLKRSEECYNGKYLILQSSLGRIKCLKLPTLQDNLCENIFVLENEEIIEPHPPERLMVKIKKQEVTVKLFTKAERDLRAKVGHEVQLFAKKVTQLIDYDISVTDKTHGIFRKFCLNHKWLTLLNREASKLFEMERNSLLEAIADQSRIRDWIMSLITQRTKEISLRLRAIFTNVVFENYSLRTSTPDVQTGLDLYRFYDIEPADDQTLPSLTGQEGEDEEDGDEDVNGKVMKKRKRYVIEGSAYEHVMSDDFTIQDIAAVTANQMYNDMAKFKPILSDALKTEFNKRFNQIKEFKKETIDSILNTNEVLMKIYKNMNCMLCLLHMETFELPELSVPTWMKDEVRERILTVDDSEVKAINRRKKQLIEAKLKSGRMLLWPPEFWKHALIVMMDGVLEKLWEEEIKKDIPIPEFMIKKHDAEYSLEDQKQLREYQEKVRLLGEDRRKYLGILRENEVKTQKLKKDYILKLNEKCAEMALWKLKYDFAMKHIRLRLLNVKTRQYKRIQTQKHIIFYKDEMDMITKYIEKYKTLQDFYEKSVSDIKARMDALAAREKVLERQFRGQYLNSIPTHLAHEIAKMYKKRPRLAQKSFNSPMVCLEVANKLANKSTTGQEFPLPNDAVEFVHMLDHLDAPQNAPNQLDLKHWDGFVKIRRQKLQNDMKLKGYGHRLADAQNTSASFTKDAGTMKVTRSEIEDDLGKELISYYNILQNQRVQITLTMGQVEVSIGGSLKAIKTCLLLNVSDVEEINEMIKKAGLKKLKAMQRVAYFRRQVITKEWEHRVVKANIVYLKYMLEVIQKCKVTIEFLEIIRKWDKVKEERKKIVSANYIEKVVEEKVAAYRKNLERIIEQIEIVKEQVRQMKLKNQQVNKQIDDVKVGVAMLTVNRDVLNEEKIQREREDRMKKIRQHHALLEEVRTDYAHILELRTILELQRLRTYPTLGPAPPECIDTLEL